MGLVACWWASGAVVQRVVMIIASEGCCSIATESDEQTRKQHVHAWCRVGLHTWLGGANPQNVAKIKQTSGAGSSE